MNKFSILSCVNVKENGYDGPCVILSCTADPSFMLFFPMTEENGKIINYVMNGKNEYDINTNILGIYRTMIDSWNSSGRYLAGIVMDSNHIGDKNEYELIIRLALCDHIGNIDSLVRVNFLHAILLAAMEEVDIIVSEDLIAQMLPTKDLEDSNLFERDDEEEGEDGDDFEPLDENISRRLSKGKKKISLYPEDKNIVDIAKKIMSGKIKEKKEKKDGKDANLDNKKSEKKS